MSRNLLNSDNMIHGTLRIGTSFTRSPLLLPETLARFRQKYPNVELLLFEENSYNCLLYTSDPDRLQCMCHSDSFRKDAAGAAAECCGPRWLREVSNQAAASSLLFRLFALHQPEYHGRRGEQQQHQRNGVHHKGHQRALGKQHRAAQIVLHQLREHKA